MKTRIVKLNLVPKGLLIALEKNIPGFSAETREIKVELAKMIQECNLKARQHKSLEGYQSFGFMELTKNFKGKFNVINGRTRIFDVTLNWSKRNHYTKGYRLMPAARLTVDKWIDENAKELLSNLPTIQSVDRSVPAAVASKDMDGRTTKNWREINQAGALSLVPVDSDKLSQLLSLIDNDIELLKLEMPIVNRENYSLGNSKEYSALIEYLEKLRSTVINVQSLAYTRLAGMNCIVHRYTEAGSGRIYAGGLNLQNAPKIVRHAAMYGCWEYDIENCHFGIISQMASKAGYECAAIDYYLSRKEEVRSEISSDVGISVDQVKTCLIALVYGARKSSYKSNAIPREIGVNAAIRLFASPLFAAIALDVGIARRSILMNCKSNRSGNLVNDFGKTLKRMGKRSPASELAHLVQGVEAKALHACLTLHPDEVILALHDGFTSKRRLCIAELEAVIMATTGYKVQLAEHHLICDLQQELRKCYRDEFSRALKSKNSNTDADLAHVLGRKPKDNRRKMPDRDARINDKSDLNGVWQEFSGLN